MADGAQPEGWARRFRPEATPRRRTECAMRLKIIAADIVLCLILLISVSRGNAEGAPHRHPGPWPIWDWHNHQPTQRQLDAMHERDVTPRQARELDRLYMQLENPKIVAPEHAR
jgi:hypothetical protein